MAETLNIDPALDDAQLYAQLLPQIASLLGEEDPALTSMSNFCAALKQTFAKISWAGFYLYNEGTLFLGPFQGKIACTRIAPMKGVCGTAFATQKCIIVEDVDKFPGHIACDSASRSEIVLPFYVDGILRGVLDLDSAEYASFTETDRCCLEKMLDILSLKLAGKQMPL